jgi:Holliday junction resolvasome RuvABC DNA-binding subunit
MGGAHVNKKRVCPECNGIGYTVKTCAEMELRWHHDLKAHVELKTLQQGSGCPKCLGLGVLHDVH